MLYTEGVAKGGDEMGENPGEMAAAQERVAALETQLWQALAAADKREAKLEGQLKAACDHAVELKKQLEAAQKSEVKPAGQLQVAHDREVGLKAQLKAAYQQSASLSDQLAVAERRIAEQDQQLADAQAREIDLTANVERLKSQQRLALAATVGGDNVGGINVAGGDVIRASPGELRDCPFCAGEGRFTRMEGPDRVIVLCQNCGGLGQVRL